jgi:hypothetical protein
MSTSNVNSNNKSSKKNIRFEHDLIEQIEQAKDPLIPFAAWVKQACRDKLNGGVVQVVTSAPKTVRPSVDAKNSKIINKAKPRYMWHTPEGSFDNRGDAVRASGIKADSLTKKCDAKIDGFSRDLV